VTPERTPSPPRKLRADVQRNRDQIVSRTALLFAREGGEVPMETIAEHAHVGVGTLYRHFPDRPALTMAVAEHLYGQIAEVLQEAADQEPDPWQALTRMIRTWVQRRLAVRKPLDRWLLDARTGSEALTELHHRIVDLMGNTLAGAQAAGALREDVTFADVIRMVGLLALADQGAGLMVEIMIDGLRAR
jgi:AcrR family transcriptional regulator